MKSLIKKIAILMAMLALMSCKKEDAVLTNQQIAQEALKAYKADHSIIKLLPASQGCGDGYSVKFHWQNFSNRRVLSSGCIFWNDPNEVTVKKLEGTNGAALQ